MHVTHLGLGTTVAIVGSLAVRLALGLASLDAISTSARQEHTLLTIPFDSIFTLQREVKRLAAVWHIADSIGRLREVVSAFWSCFSSTTKS
jgi:hypothetical protein